HDLFSCLGAITSRVFVSPMSTTARQRDLRTGVGTTLIRSPSAASCPILSPYADQWHNPERLPSSPCIESDPATSLTLLDVLHTPNRFRYRPKTYRSRSL